MRTLAIALLALFLLSLSNGEKVYTIIRPSKPTTIYVQVCDSYQQVQERITRKSKEGYILKDVYPKDSYNNLLLVMEKY